MESEMDEVFIATTVDRITATMGTQGVDQKNLFHAALWNIAESKTSGMAVSGWFLQKSGMFPQVMTGFESLCDASILRIVQDQETRLSYFEPATPEIGESLLALFKRM